jgi:F-type H+-transporting ATPase subunit gamma
MAGGRAIKARIKTTKNIQQITKAMEAVSAVKMRKSEAAAIKGRLYALYALHILKKIEKSIGKKVKLASPLFEVREIKKQLLVVISSDKGLAGSFNSNVLKKAGQFAEAHKDTVSVVAIGKKAKEFFERRGFNIVKSFEGAGDLASLSKASPITDFIIDLFVSKQFDKIDVIYTNFISALKQEVVHRPLLPLNEKTLIQVIENIIPETGRFSEFKNIHLQGKSEYKFEPTPEAIIEELVPSLVTLEMFHSILEANASEHAARMVAMKNASTNAKEMIGKLTIKYNKERQAQITKELIEIVSGKEALAAQE